jgi:ubiquinone/menaquinone biosynthesis C-methylase UbiE
MQPATATVDLQSIAQDLTHLAPNPLTYERLCEWVEGIDWLESGWEAWVPEATNPNDYGRNILCLEPFEMVLLHWPAGVESAVHHHAGFWGAVVCLQGILENVTYEKRGQVLREKEVLRAYPSGIVPEPDGTLHKIKNGSPTEPLVTLHFYNPALADLDGLVLYDLPSGRTFTCNDLAPTASVKLPNTCYHEIRENAFEFQPTEEASHIQCNVVPKPDPGAVEGMIMDYFAEQANRYDALDKQIIKRRTYTEAINLLVANGIKELNEVHEVHRVMHLACGTGRRAAAIRQASGLDYEMLGLDLCEEMVAIAGERDLHVKIGSLRLPDAWIKPEKFEIVTLLYAFGHLPNRAIRNGVIKSAFKMLKPGGRFFFDAFDIEDAHEWGPEARRQFFEQRLARQGYEEGDVFYRRAKGEHLAFLHYCSADRLRNMMEEAGFVDLEMTTVGYDQASGAESHNGKLFVVGTKPLR